MDAKQFIEKHSFYPLHKTHLKTEKDFKYFAEGLVGYQSLGDTFVIAGDPICPKKTDIPKVLDQFALWAKDQKKTTCGYYFSEYAVKQLDTLKSYSAGISIGTQLSKFSLQGKEGKELRRAINYGDKRKLQFTELSRQEYFENFYEIKNLESKWFKGKSKFRKIKFLLSSIKIDNDKISDRHFVIKDKNEKIISYVSLDRYKEANKQHSFYIDHLFQHPSKYSLALDYLLVKILLLLREEGHKYLDFGFCPFKDVQLKGLVGTSLYFAQFVKQIYNSKGIYDYKKKFCNHRRPVYLLMSRDKSKLTQLYTLFKVTFS